MRGIERAKADIAAGRLWKARDRLQGVLAQTPCAPDVLALLGEVLYAMHDLPDAGRYWFLTDLESDLAAEAIRAFEERSGRNACHMLRSLPIGTSLETYPQVVQDRIARLRERCGEWQPRRRPGPAAFRTTRWDRFKAAMVLAIVGLLLLGGFVWFVLWVLSAFWPFLLNWVLPGRAL